jgi:hypothetical protein
MPDLNHARDNCRKGKLKQMFREARLACDAEQG